MRAMQRDYVEGLCEVCMRAIYERLCMRAMYVCELCMYESYLMYERFRSR